MVELALETKILIGTVVVLIIIIVVLSYYCSRKRRRDPEEGNRRRDPEEGNRRRDPEEGPLISAEEERLQRENNELQVKLGRVQEEKDELQRRLRRVQEEKDKPQIKLGRDQEEKDKPQIKLGRVQEEKDELQRRLRRVQEEKDELQVKLERVQKEKDELQAKLGRIQEQNSELQRKLNELQGKLNVQEVELKWRRTHKETDNITLNPDTAHPNLSISGDKKSLKHETQPQNVPSTPERFDSTVCVLGLEGFSSEKHYWQVDVGSSTEWDLGVARISIQRKGKLSLCPKEGFWILGFSGRDYWAKTDPWTRVMVQKKPNKIEVYLSYQDRQVTFLNVTDGSVLFTFNDCSFSGEVYPFFKISHKETTMRICSIREDE